MDTQTSLHLCRFIREEWNSVGDESVDSLHPPTPEELAIELCSGYNKSTTFKLFDAGCILAITLIGMGHDPSNIYVFESPEFEYHYAIAKDLSNKLGFTIIEYDPQQKLIECNMDFNVTMGNPPYQMPDNESKRWVLWHKFLELAMNHSDRVSYVIPTSITSPGKMWNLIRENLVSVDFTVGDHFKGVGSTFCHIVVDKKFSGETSIITECDKLQLDVSDYDFLPPVVNEHTMSLYSRFSKNRKWKISTEYHTTKKSNWSDDSGEIEVWHTNAQTFKTSIPHPNNNLIRVGVSLSGYPEFKVMNNIAGSQIIVYTVCDTVDEAESLAEHLNGPDIQEVMSVFKWSGWNKKEVIELLG